MDFASVIALLQVIVANLPNAIATVEQLYGLGEKFYETLNGTAPSADVVTQLRAAIDADVALALAPLPAAQPGDPDYTG